MQFNPTTVRPRFGLLAPVQVVCQNEQCWRAKEHNSLANSEGDGYRDSGRANENNPAFRVGAAITRLIGLLFTQGKISDKGTDGALEYSVTLPEDQSRFSGQPPNIRFVLATDEPDTDGNTGSKDWQNLCNLSEVEQSEMLAKVARTQPIVITVDACPPNGTSQINPFRIVSAKLPNGTVITPDSSQSEQQEPAGTDS